ncbi:hypothetical protein [Lewinella sp. W8]|uniref:hypothetical protein n=1 Tax=Lewinella sp. W8 TaxID=2528208 RepID=UPI0011033F08|nr:hypothetical protein [Lewinella sp. W8]MTB53014.1 hypothetical protein [Lewinella sp. W8]
MRKTLVDDAIASGFNLSALVKARVQRRGEDYQGKDFPPYTDDYAERGRRDLGYQDEYFDFTRTGEAWKSVGVFVKAKDDDSVTVSIRSDSPSNQVKFAGAVRKRGNILRSSEQERSLVLKDFANRRRERFQKLMNEQ